VSSRVRVWNGVNTGCGGMVCGSGGWVIVVSKHAWPATCGGLVDMRVFVGGRVKGRLRDTGQGVCLCGETLTAASLHGAHREAS